MNRQLSLRNTNVIGWTKRVNVMWVLTLLLAVAVGASLSGELANTVAAKPADSQALAETESVGGSVLLMPPANNYLAIHPSAFTISNSDLSYLLTGTALRGTVAGETFLANAPVQLPHGAEIMGFEVLVMDSSVARDFLVTLWRTPDDSLGPETIVTLGTNGTPGTTKLVSGPLSHDVDNMTGAYTVTIAWEVPATPSNIMVRNVRIIYRDTPGRGG